MTVRNDSLMKKTIELTPKSTKWIYIINGIIHTAIGIRQLTVAEQFLSWAGIIGVLLVVAGPVSLFIGLIVFKKNNRLCPKIEIDESGLMIREDIHRSERRIDWKNIKEVIFKPLALDFNMVDDTVEKISLITNSDISIEVKKAIREFATLKQVTVVSG